MGKKGSGKEERKARKAELNRERSKGRRRREVALDQREVASFAKLLLADGLELHEVARDGNCFFRSLCDQCEGHEHDHEKYRVRVMEHVETHEDEFAPFMSFGESEEEEDKDFDAYVERMKTDGEWAGQVELIAAAQALSVHIVVHQFEHPSYRIECRHSGSGSKAPRDIHLSYHDGEHYNSVRPLRRGLRERGGAAEAVSGSNSFRGLRVEGDADPEEAGEGSSEVGGLADGVANVSLGHEDEEDAVALHEVDGNAMEGGAKGGSKKDVKKDKSQMTKKQKKQEAKRERQAERHREALTAAGGGDEAASRASADCTESGRSVIVL